MKRKEKKEHQAAQQKQPPEFLPIANDIDALPDINISRVPTEQIRALTTVVASETSD